MTKTVDGVIAKQQGAVSDTQAQARAAQNSLNDALHSQDLDRAKFNTDGGIDPRINVTRTFNQQSQNVATATGNRDKAAGAADQAGKALAVENSVGGTINNSEQIPDHGKTPGDLTSANASMAAAKTEYGKLAAMVPANAGQQPPKLGELLSPAQRLQLSTNPSSNQQAQYDKYATAVGNAAVDTSKLDSRVAHIHEGATQTTAYAANPAYAPAVSATRSAFDNSLAPQGLEVNIPKVPAPANGDKAGQLQSLNQQVSDASRGVKIADGSWDRNTSVVESLKPGMVAAQAATVKSPNSQAAKDGAKTLAPLNNTLDVKTGYLNSQLGSENVAQAQVKSGASQAALENASISDPHYPELLKTANADRTGLQVAHDSADAAGSEFKAALAQDAASHATAGGGPDFTAAANTLNLQANEQATRAQLHALQPQIDALKATGVKGLNPNDPKSTDQLTKMGENALAVQAHDAAVGAQLRNGFEQNLPGELRQPVATMSNSAMANLEDRQYAFFKNNPQALAGLPSDTVSALRQDPNAPGPANLGAAAMKGFDGSMEVLGGTLTALAPVPVIAQAAGVVAIGDGAVRVGSAIDDAIEGKSTPPPQVQALEAMGLDRHTAAQTDNFGRTALMVPQVVFGSAAALAAPGALSKGAGLLGLGFGGDQVQAGFRGTTPMGVQAFEGAGLDPTRANIMEAAGGGLALVGLGRLATRGNFGASSAPHLVTSFDSKGQLIANPTTEAPTPGSPTPSAARGEFYARNAPPEVLSEFAARALQQNQPDLQPGTPAYDRAHTSLVGKLRQGPIAVVRDNAVASAPGAGPHKGMLGGASLKPDFRGSPLTGRDANGQPIAKRTANLDNSRVFGDNGANAQAIYTALEGARTLTNQDRVISSGPSPQLFDDVSKIAFDAPDINLEPDTGTPRTVGDLLDKASQLATAPPYVRVKLEHPTIMRDAPELLRASATDANGNLDKGQL
ncbi:MAG: hypothetical protein ACREM6_09715, partial [Vulcanimicrobiaceae bacterium]